MTRPDHMEKARDIESGFECDWTADGRRRGEAEEEAAIVAIARALAAAEQRGREEEREKLARRYDDEADRLEQASIDTLSVADKLRLDASAAQCRDLAAAIRRGDGTAPPSSPPEQNGESATPSHAPVGET